MNGKCFVDTNILIYAHDRAAGKKHSRAKEVVQELWEAGTAVISTQVLQELCVNLRRRVQPPVQPERLRAILQAYVGWEVVSNGPQSVLQALDLELRYKISFWDALIVNAAEESGCDLLYSEDMSAGQSYGPVLVVNPFA